MRSLLLVLSAFVLAALPVTSAFAGGGDPIGCYGPYPPCVQDPDEPNGERLCIIIDGNEFCLDPKP